MNDPFPIQTLLVDSLRVRVHQTRREMGLAASGEAARRLRLLLDVQKQVRVVFAAAPSQNEFLDGLCEEPGIDWSRVTAFHMDEYIGLPGADPQTFAHYLKGRLFQRVEPGTVHLIDTAGGAEQECRRYSALLREAPIDMVCLGIGENGHLAFNDPPVADFGDPALVKVVKLDLSCRQQQVNDGCFPVLEAVPTHAITLTIPALLSAVHLLCMVPGERKRQAVRQTIEAPVTTACPSTVLRRHPDCTLYVDKDAFGADA